MSGNKLIPLVSAIIMLTVLVSSCESDLLLSLEEEVQEQVYESPKAPEVSSIARTSGLKPVWTWTIPARANTIEYQLNNQDDTGWERVGIQITSFTPSEPLSEGNHTLYVRALGGKDNNLTSPVGSFTVCIDLSSPDAPVMSGPVITNNQKPTWTWVVPEGAVKIRHQLDTTYENKWNDEVLTATTFTPANNLDDGNHTFYLQAANDLGTWSEIASYTITIDTIAPQPPLVSGESPTIDTTPAWSWTLPAAAADKVYIRYSFDGLNWTTSTDNTMSAFTPESAFSQDGTYRLYVQVQDRAGNWSSSGSKSITIDTTAPVFEDTLRSEDRAVKSKVWNWSSDDLNAQYRYVVNTSPTAPSSWGNTTWSNTKTTTIGGFDGAYYLHVQAKDALGNMNEVKTVKAVLSNTAPDAPVVSTSADYTRLKKPTWSWTIPEGTVQCRYRLDGNTWEYVGLKDTFTPLYDLSAGTHLLEVQASNSNQADALWSATGLKTVTIDYVNPYVEAGNTIEWVKTTSNLEGDASDASPFASIKWEQIGGNGTVTFDNSSSPSTTVTGPAGVESEYILKLTAVDQAVNQSSDTVIFKWDDKAPVPGNAGALALTDVNSTSVTVSWTKATDLSSGDDTLQYKVVGSTSNNIGTIAAAQLTDQGRFVAMPWVGGTTSKSVSTLTSGQTYYFTVLVKDRLDNISIYTVDSIALSATGGFTLTVESIQNEAITFSQSENVVISQSSNLTVTISETFDTYEWSLYGLNLSSKNTNSVTITGSSLHPGIHTLTFYGTKNGKLYSKNLTFKIIN